MVFQPFSNHVKNWLKLKIYLVIFCLLLLSIFLNIPLMWWQLPIILFCPETGTMVFEWDHLWLHSLCQMVVATIIILPCNIALVIKLKKEGYFKKFGKQIMDKKKIHIGCLPTLKLADFRITLVSIGISLFFIIAILPITLFLFLVSFSEVFPNFPFDKQSELIYVVCFYIGFLYFSANSMFYFFISPECRQELKVIIVNFVNLRKINC